MADEKGTIIVRTDTGETNLSELTIDVFSEQEQGAGGGAAAATLECELRPERRR